MLADVSDSRLLRPTYISQVGITLGAEVKPLADHDRFERTVQYESQSEGRIRSVSSW